MMLEDHERIGQCPVCKEIFVVPNQFATKQNMYRLADDALRARNFDMALNYYSRILKVDAIAVAAHWGYLLSKYGIEISKDLRTYDHIIFHRIERTSILEDPSYEKLMTYCPEDAKAHYGELTRRVAAKQKQLWELAANVGEYDVYLNCVEGRGTADYILANQVGKALDDAGYRVFLPCTMINNIPEADKNLYEMAVAEKAASMIVVVTKGTSLDHPRYQAIWKRYLTYRRQDAGRKMLSVYQDMKPEQLPLELQPLQSMECSGLNFQETVLAEINKMFGRQNRSMSVTREILDQLREGGKLLEEERYGEAAAAFRRVRELDAEESRAHWGLVCSATHNLTKPVLQDELDNNYQRALQFAEIPQKEQYRKLMSVLMTDAAWDALKRQTKDFTDTKANGTDSVEAAIQRVYLYMPRGDVRLAEIEAYHKRTKMDREAERLIQAYRSRDTVTQPLFVDQKKAESEYMETQIESSGFIHNSKIMTALTTFSLFAFLAAQTLMVLHFNTTTGYHGFTYQIARLFFIAGLGALVVWAGKLTDSLFDEVNTGLIIGGIAAVVVMFIARKTTRPVYLFIGIVPLILLLIQRIRVLLLSRNVDASIKRRKVAAERVREADSKVVAAYHEEMKAHYAKYGQPNHTYPQFEAPHSKDFSLDMTKHKRINPILYILTTVLIYVVAFFGPSVVSNMLYASGWSNIVSISASGYHTLGLRESGEVVANGLNDHGQCDVSSWSDIVQIDTGYAFSAGLREDGTVVVAGDQELFAEVATWKDVVYINASHDHLVGLKSNGTLVAAGSNGNGECDVEQYTNVVKVLANTDGDGSLTLVLMEDGSVRITDKNSWENVAAWTEAHTGSGEDQMTVNALYGETGGVIMTSASGRVQGIGSDYYHQLSQAEDWNAHELKEIFTSDFTVGLKHDGSVCFAGNNLNAQTQIETWSDIADLEGGYSFVLGLREDGTVVAAGNNQSGQCDVDEWEDIAQIYAGHQTSYGVTEDGDVVAAGYSLNGLTYTKNKNPIELLKMWVEALRW